MKPTILKDISKLNVYIPDYVEENNIEPQESVKKTRKTNPKVEAFKEQLRREAENKRNRGVK